MNFESHTEKTAPSESKSLLENSLNSFGMIPNLHAVMAAAPAVLEGYQTLTRLFGETSFDDEEMTVIWQTINVENECHYCVPAHTGIANMMNVDNTITEALRNRTELPTEKLQVLHLTTLGLVRNRGRLSDEALASFLAAGYEKHQLLEIVLGISHKVLSNYINHLAKTPVDEAFQAYAWQG